MAGPVLFVNPWSGIIGPNVGMRQLVSETLRRHVDTHVVNGGYDPFLEASPGLNAAFHCNPGVRLIARESGWRPWLQGTFEGFRSAAHIGGLCRDIGARSICINSENMLFMPRAGVIGQSPVICVVRGVRFGEVGAHIRLFFRIHSRWVTKYLAVSNTVAASLCRIGVSPRKIKVVYNGVNLDDFSPSLPSSSLRKKLLIPSDAKIVGCISHMEPRKGIHHLVRSFARIRKIANVFCLVVGGATNQAEERYASEVKEMVRALNMQDRIIFTGYREDTPDLIRLMDVMVHPSETESFGRAIAEGMACGKPIVAFRVGAVPELVSDGRTGIIIEPFETDAMAKAVEELLMNPRLRRQMALNSRARAVELFDERKNVSAAVDLILSPDDDK